MAVRSYDTDTYFIYVFTVTLNLEIWHWLQIMTHPLVMVNICGKYDLHPIWIKELWSGQDMNMHTVRRTGRQTESQGDLFAVGIISKVICI